MFIVVANPKLQHNTLLINPYLHFHDFIICSAGMQSLRHE